MNKKKQRISDGLGKHVRNKYDIAKDYKASVFDTLQDCLDLVRGVPTAELDASIDFDLSANIVAPIVRGVVGMIRDIYGQNSEKPFVVEPTTIVELPTTIRAELESALAANRESMFVAAGYDTTAVQAEVDKLKNTLRESETKRAHTAADEISKVLQDTLEQGGWSQQFEAEFLQSFVIFPTAILKSPVYSYKYVPKWDGMRRTVSRELTTSVEHISPFNIYPSPDAVDAQNADYIIERRRVTQGELIGLLSDGTYDVDGIQDVLTNHNEGHLEEYEDGSFTLGVVNSTDTNHNPTCSYDCLGYYGKVSGESLSVYGVQGVDVERSYEAEIWIIKDTVIKAVLNSDVLGRRPFFSASFEPIPNAFWGECPVTRIAEFQRGCTSAMAHLIRNMALSSGPHIERDVSRLESDPTDTLSPYEIIDVKPPLVGGTQTAYVFRDVQSHMTELLSLYDKFKAEAYEAIGIPRALFGGIDGLGAVGRTSGGIAAVYAQASKAIKYSMRILEERIIEPALQRIVESILTTNDDPQLAGDVRVRAKGVSGIIEKENQREQLNWAMQSLVPMLSITGADGKPVIPPEAPVRLLYEQFKALGIPTAGIFKDYDSIAAIQSDVGTAPSIVPQPTLDGRSADGMAALDAIGGVGYNQGNGGMP